LTTPLNPVRGRFHRTAPELSKHLHSRQAAAARD
jgi:hypothetical protein